MGVNLSCKKSAVIHRLRQQRLALRFSLSMQSILE